MLTKNRPVMFRQLCGHSNNYQPILDITCFLRPPGDWEAVKTGYVQNRLKIITMAAKLPK